ncbi:MAG: hypothetical protein SOZ49_02590 [Clostridiaceae bacterium]|nr:hypothetical protein [Clostridiaceae bacterium]
MEVTDYQRYTISTIESYPTKYRKNLRSLFISKGIAQEDTQMSLGSLNAIDISGYNLNQQLNKCIEENTESLKVFEAWEFTKDYKYSVLFSTAQFNELLDRIDQNTPHFDGSFSPLYNTLEHPLFYDYDAHIALLKFNLKFEAVHPQTAEELLARYPVVVAFHKDAKIIEIRFDALKRFFMENTDSFYAHLADDVCKFIKDFFEHELTPLDLDFLVTNAQHENSHVRLVAQTMKMANGSYAQLDVGKNEEYILPFIGELKNFLIEYATEFEKVPHLKDAFDQFIFEKEVTSDYPWIELLWEEEIKTRSIHVKFTFNYCQRGYCLLQHYFNNTLIGMERMNRVVNFIDEVRRNPQ